MNVCIPRLKVTEMRIKWKWFYHNVNYCVWYINVIFQKKVFCPLRVNRWFMHSPLLLKNHSFFYYSFIHMCIHCLGHFSLLPLPPPSTPPTSRQNLFCTFPQFHWRVEISNNKKDIEFLLVEIRTAIQRDS
jgi:hypothetical protein